jgi:hypothetical protein
MTLHEAIDALIVAIESGNTGVTEKAVAAARAAQEAYPADEVETDIVPEDLADAPEADAHEAPEAPGAPEADAPEAPEAENPANLDG